MPDFTDQRVPDLVASLIRTWVPIGVGALLAWFAASRHVVLPAHASAALGAFAAAVCASAYYGLARWLEHARAGALRSVGRYMLGGVAKVPTYRAAE